jgi:hypothetical protein
MAVSWDAVIDRLHVLEHDQLGRHLVCARREIAQLVLRQCRARAANDEVFAPLHAQLTNRLLAGHDQHIVVQADEVVRPVQVTTEDHVEHLLAVTRCVKC